jgi:hypothetical protein
MLHRKNVPFIKKKHPHSKGSKRDKKFIPKPGGQLG